MAEDKRRSRTNSTRSRRSRNSRSGSAAGRSIRKQADGDSNTARQTSGRSTSAGQTSGRRTGSSGGTRVRKRQTKRRRQRNLFLRVFFVILAIIVIVVGVFLWRRYSPSREEADLNEYYGIEQEGQLAVILNQENLGPEGILSDGVAYVKYEVIRDDINSRFYWDSNENLLLYTLPEDVVKVEVGSQDYTVSKDKQTKDYVILKTEGSTAYVALDFVQQYTDMDYEVYTDEVNRVVIETDWDDRTVATVKSKTQVRYRGGVKSEVLTEVDKDATVVVLDQEENWTKVCTEDGLIGYVRKSNLKDERTEEVNRDFEEPEYSSLTRDYTINMAWHNVTNETANSTVLERIANTKGLTTIAPTWYHVADTDGNLESISSATYVDNAHQSNVEVWATVRDFDGGISSSDESYEFLSSTSKRENLINALIADALQVGVDGINVDFEKINTDCGEHFIQFIRELSVRCRQNSLVLSVDNYPPKNYNEHYDLKEQGIVADYVVIMGYDEYYSGSPEAGPVSSYNYVKEGIEGTLEKVPAEKVISGIPFYTRLWSETPKTEEELAEEAGTDAADYPMNVESENLGMEAAAARVASAGVEATWDEETKSDYATWEEEDTTYEIWLENADSIEPKLQLMKDNGLAGSAAWALGQEDPEIWQLILQYVN